MDCVLHYTITYAVYNIQRPEQQCYPEPKPARILEYCSYCNRKANAYEEIKNKEQLQISEYWYLIHSYILLVTSLGVEPRSLR